MGRDQCSVQDRRWVLGSALLPLTVPLAPGTLPLGVPLQFWAGSGLEELGLEGAVPPGRVGAGKDQLPILGGCRWEVESWSVPAIFPDP